MPQFFIKNTSINGTKVIITGSDSHHLVRVRRVREGEEIMLRTDDGKGYLAKIISLEHDSITAEILSEINTMQSLPDITLYIALLKGGNFEFVIQKAVEIGVNRIVPVVSERTVPDPDKMTDKKVERWNKIASEAGKQCLRSLHALIESPVKFRKALDEENSGVKIICHPGADIQIKDFLITSEGNRKISVLIGPEGGFSPSEIEEAVNKEWVPVNMGANHLRAETAAIIIPSIIIYELS